MAPRAILVLPSETLLTVGIPLASRTSMMMLPRSDPSVSILDPTRTGSAAWASDTPIKVAAAAAIRARRWRMAIMLRLLQGPLGAAIVQSDEKRCGARGHLGLGGKTGFQELYPIRSSWSSAIAARMMRSFAV